MRQLSWHTKNYENLPDIAAQIRQTTTDLRRAVLLILNEDFAAERAQSMLKLFRDALPELTVIGMTNHARDYEHLRQTDAFATFLLLIFERSSFEICFSDLSRTSERNAAVKAAKRLRHTRDAKGVLVFSSGIETDVELYLDKLSQTDSSLPIFGATAAIRSITTQDAVSYLLYNGEAYPHAVLSVILSGGDLHIQADAGFGWTPLGKKMTVTKMAGRNTVLTIDDRPAADIFQRYLGLEASQIQVENCCEFPIIHRAGNRIAARISIQAREDGAVQFGGPLHPGDEIRFSYGYPEDIFAETRRNAARLSAFGAQTLLLSVCMNRILFLGEAQEREIDMFRESVQDPVVIHGNTELFRDSQGGGELNSSLIYFALREGPQSERPVIPHADPARNTVGQRIPFALRLLTFLDVTTRELEELETGLEEEVARKTGEIVRQQNRLNQINREIVETLSNAIDAKDAYTNGHSRRVAAYSREIARRYGYDARRQEDVYMIGLLHDVGKIGIPDAIINKPDKLTEEEYAVIRRHPVIGAEILSRITEFPDVAYGAHWHHERYDGKGYPDGLSGEAIPEIAQIISVADAYDAMASKRSYRPVMDQEKVRSEIEKGRGTLFSPRFADIMLEMIDEDTDYRMTDGTNHA